MMNEKYLHFIWNKKRLPFHQIKTTKNETIEFLHIGDYNAIESGPDFSMAKARIDGLIWIGAIEIHVKSSDWYRHRHHLDKAYNNVILHVVYIHDMEVQVCGKTLPVIELKSHIEFDHYMKFKKLHGNTNSLFPCKSLLSEKVLVELEIMKELAIKNRLNRKTTTEISYGKDYFHFNFLKLMASAFGTSVNRQPFEQLINSFSLDELKNFCSKKKEQVLKNFCWKRKGLFSDPEKRLSQFIDFVRVVDFEFHFWELPAPIIHLYFEKQFKRAKITSTFLLNNFIINCVVRYIFWKGSQLGNLQLTQKAKDLLKLIPEESNHLTRKWKQLGVLPKNAFDSQALLEIYEQFCSRKACLNCAVGKKILTI
jgi:hypothetical protein